MSLVSVNGLSISNKQKDIVKDISFQILKGEWLAIVGQSGSGKSLTSSAIGQLLGPNLRAAGNVSYEGMNLLELPPKKMRALRGTRISYIFQDYQGSFTPFHTIGRHFQEFLKTHLKLSKDVRKKKAEEALKDVGLQPEIYSRYPFQLSGGQLQRVSIALALLLEPDILIADEPTTALDSITSFKVLQLLEKLQQEKGCAILFITHDLRHVKNHADRILVMKEGEIVEQGEKRQVLDNPVHPYTKLLIEASSPLRKPATEKILEVAK
ncbi:ABC transporter ATP-binding protein [Planococcus halotolerans]|uniref:ABC transporter ATP-binding protein n=1 Tax=Planococcus halotolerans TaxID=2233542 RepID=A0A365L7F3_9BACL|nr:ABC transporter ATP-binding protein [Planococcus halotolerans]RAZ81342.1 ABC transporter ATP-binding protein [Planococcus halotolerans]